MDKTKLKKILIRIIIVCFINGCSNNDKKNNDSTIKVDGGQIGMTARSGGNDYVENNGRIEVFADGVGMKAIGGPTMKRAKNYKDIYVKGDEAVGMLATSDESEAINYGIIYVENTEGGTAMKAKHYGTAINGKNGVIHVDKENSYGMIAEGDGSIAINYGIINVNKKNSYAMISIGTGSKAINYGTIHLNHSSLDKDNALLKISNGKIINYGSIVNHHGSLVTMSLARGISYAVGTTPSGTYGTIFSKAIALEGNLEISADIAAENYNDLYILKYIVKSENIKINESFELSSTSLLYDASYTKTNDGLDGILTRNKNTIKSLVSAVESEITYIFDKAIDDKAYRETLTNDSRELLKNVFDATSSKTMLSYTLNDLSGYIHGNIPRQIFRIKDTFNHHDSSIISSLGKSDFNFTYISSFDKTDGRYGIKGYESKLNGVLGAAKVSDGLYGTIGYGHSDIDYNNSTGKIDTIHLSLYKYKEINGFDLKLGIIGEYNIHETNRKIKSFNENAKSKYNSYLVGLNGELSKTYGNTLYITPSLGFELSYVKYENFAEKGSIASVSISSEDYLSVVPDLELRLGKKFNFVDIYASIKYSYELGNVEKNPEIKLGNFDSYHLSSDELKGTSMEVKVGLTTSYKSFSLMTEVGKNYGKRDNKFVKVGFGYTF
ncbi:autotransporter outer membrane beta-barrel domain-containing protein [Fusobacterium sp. PH5-44]|uniref:autotransporter family protein n=1 Tax=unclassified Fusobacterium TaxID=2648384 RepID=UPI003D1A048C